MEPVEINAGSCYLRQLRADGFIDDRAALSAAFEDPLFRRFVPGFDLATTTAAGEYVERRAQEWLDGTRCSWAIAEPTTGDLLGEVGLKRLDLPHGNAETAIWLRPGARGRGLATTAVGAALRFGFGALGLTAIHYLHEPDNVASGAVAGRCGFTYVGPVLGTRDVRWSVGPGEVA
ncbi:GNAT family N-acetyltransferase [Saccharomonospora sp. NPDC006951]